MPWSMLPFQYLVEVTEMEIPLFGGTIHFVHCRVEEDVAMATLQEVNVAVNRARVLFEVFRVVELGGVNKNAANHHVRQFPGTRNEGEVAIVQRTHGWHEGYTLPVLSIPFKEPS